MPEEEFFVGLFAIIRDKETRGARRKTMAYESQIDWMKCSLCEVKRQFFFMKITFGYNAATCKLMSACHMIFRSSAQSHWLLNIDSKDNFFKEQFRMRQVWLGAAVSMMTHKITASGGHNILIPVSFSPRTMRLRCVRSTHNTSLRVIVLPALSTSKPFTQETKNKIVLAALPEPINMMYTRPLVLCGTSDRGRDVEHQARPLGS